MFELEPVLRIILSKILELVFLLLLGVTVEVLRIDISPGAYIELPTTQKNRALLTRTTQLNYFAFELNCFYCAMKIFSHYVHMQLLFRLFLLLEITWRKICLIKVAIGYRMFYFFGFVIDRLFSLQCIFNNYYCTFYSPCLHSVKY